MEMATGRLPWSHLGTPMQILNYLADDSKEIILPLEHLSPMLHAFLRDILQRDPLKRPTAQALMDHPFFFYDTENLTQSNRSDGAPTTTMLSPRVKSRGAPTSTGAIEGSSPTKVQTKSSFTQGQHRTSLKSTASCAVTVDSPDRTV
eukprot:PhF_6_TR26432/c0_g1_i1/m.38258